MNLSSRPNAPFALWLQTGPRDATTFNGRDVAPFSGFSDSDAQVIFDTVKSAWCWWNVDVVTGDEPTKPHVGIGFANSFGYPGGGQANVGSWQTGGIQAYVFPDVLQSNATYCGLDAVHESGHVLGGFSDLIVNGVYQWGFWMGMPLGIPRWQVSERQTLDQRFGPASDVNGDGLVNLADANLLRDSGGTLAELMAVARDAKYGKSVHG